MKKITILSLCVCLTTLLNAQIWENNLRKTISAPSIQERNNAFETYRQNHKYSKSNGFKPYAREMDFLLERSSENSYFKSNALYDEWKKGEISYKNTNTAANWIAKGPINTPIIMSHKCPRLPKTTFL